MPKYTEQDFNNQMNYLSNTKTLMMQAIANKGQNITSYTPFREYANIISNIEGGSGLGVGGQNSNILHFKNIEEMDSYIKANDRDMAFVYNIDNSHFRGVFTAEPSNTRYHGYSFVNNIRLDTSGTSPKVDFDHIDDYISIQDMNTLKNILLNNNIITDNVIINDRIRTIEKLEDNKYAVYHFYYDWETDFLTIPDYVEDEKIIIHSTFNQNYDDCLFYDETEDKIYPYLSIYGSNASILLENREGSRHSISALLWIQICQNIDINMIKNINGYHAYKYIVDISNNTCTIEEYNNFIDSTRYEGVSPLEIYLPDWDFTHKKITMVNLFSFITGPRLGIAKQNSIYEYNNLDLKTYTNCFIPVQVPFTANAVSVTEGWFYGANSVEQGEMFDNKRYDTEEEKDKLAKRLNLYYSPEKINTSSLTNCTNYFYNTNILISPILNTSLVTSMYHMFYACYNMTTVSLYNTSLVTNMASMFYYCYNITTVPNFNTINVTNMAAMFDGCNNLITVPNFNTSNVTDMSSMFGGMNWAGKSNMRHVCENLISVPNFNTCNVTTMYWMFAHCENLTSVPNFNTSKVTNMQSMFQNCYNLTTIPNFYTSALVDAAYMLEYCYSLTSVPNFNTSKVNNTVNMFMNCTNLKSVPNFNFTSLKNGWGMFANCINLTTVPAFNIRGATNVCNMFINCNNLTDASYHNIANVLPQASSLSNTNISNTGLNSDRFTTADKYILTDKGYTGIEIPNAQQYIISYE